MEPEGWARQRPLPVAIHRETGEPVSLELWRNDPEVTVAPADLSPEQQVLLVIARWRAGAWTDLIYGNDGEVDLGRAIREVETGSEMGRQLLAVGLRAIEMAREDAEQVGEG
jgi:hypothetical protein